MAKASRPKRTTEKQKEVMLTNLLEDFVSEGAVDELFAYLEHVGVDVSNLPPGADGRLLLEHFYAHYRRSGKIDVDRAFQDLVEYPPIAAYVKELRAEKQVMSRGSSI